jgi:hypothetical protein
MLDVGREVSGLFCLGRGGSFGLLTRMLGCRLLSRRWLLIRKGSRFGERILV